MFPLIRRGHVCGVGVTTYLLVRDADGAILEEFSRAEVALRALEAAGGFESGLSVVRFHDAPGEVAGTTSLIKARLANFPTAASRSSRRPGRG
jgi:hypothetical protein